MDVNMLRIPGHFVRSVPTIRKIAIGAWSHPKDPSIYARLRLDMSAVKQFIFDQHSEGVRLRPYMVVLAALSQTLAEYPELNRCIIRGKLFQRRYARLFIPVMLKSTYGDDLLGVSVDDVHLRSARDLAREIRFKVKQLRLGNDKEMTLMKRLFRFGCPQILSSLVISIFDFFFYTLNINFFKLPKDRFGSIIFSDLSSLGFDSAFVPLFPFSRTALSVALGTEQMSEGVCYQELMITSDHRVFDGRIAARAKDYFLGLISDPSRIFAGVQDA